MELFSEIYSCYYQVVADILRRAIQNPISAKEIADLVKEQAFAESGLYIIPRLFSGEWDLLVPQEDKFGSKVGRVPIIPMTTVQKAWVKAVLQDARIGLFLSHREIEQLENALGDVEPLFDVGLFDDFDNFLDGDPYADKAYQAVFGQIAKAQKNREILEIRYYAPNSGLCVGNFVPCMLEFSRRDNKFRCYMAKIIDNKVMGILTVNIARISAAVPLGICFENEIDLEKYFADKRCAQPVLFQIQNQRNALERVLLQLASYEKRTEYVEESDSYLCTVFYHRDNETELLINILAFGPVIRVLAPESFLERIRRRVRRQHLLLGK